MTAKTILTAVSTLVLLSACVSSGGGETDTSVEAGDVIDATGTGLIITIDHAYDTGAVLGSFENENGYGQTYRSDPQDIAADPGSTRGAGITTGNRTDYAVTASSADFDRVGTRYQISINDGTEAASSQIKYDVDGPNLDIAVFGSPLTDIPSGTIVYGESTDNAAFLHLGDETVEMAFTFTADLDGGTATLSADNGSHVIDGGVIEIDAASGIFYGTDAELGPTGETVSGVVSGALFGTEAAGVAGMVFSTDEAAPSVTANFVGNY